MLYVLTSAPTLTMLADKHFNDAFCLFIFIQEHNSSSNPQNFFSSVAVIGSISMVAVNLWQMEGETLNRKQICSYNFHIRMVLLEVSV